MVLCPGLVSARGERGGPGGVGDGTYNTEKLKHEYINIQCLEFTCIPYKYCTKHDVYVDNTSGTAVVSFFYVWAANLNVQREPQVM